MNSSRQPPHGPPLTRLEICTLAHVGLLLLLGTWAFGGGATWARFLLSCWGSLGLLITLAAARDRAGRPDGSLRPLRWLWAPAAFTAMVLLSCLNPSFTEKFLEGQSLLAFTGAAYPRLPSTAHPPASLEHLWLFDATYLTCFNLALVIRQRRALRWLLLAACVNAVVLSVFGTFQRLLSDGLFFGLVPSPNPRFFATFIYGNHWAAYIVLMIAASAGLVFFYTRHRSVDPLSGSPLGIGIISLLLMAMTPALCGSRAGIVLVCAVMFICVSHALLAVLRRRRSHHESVAMPVAGLALCVTLTVGGAVYLGQAPLRERWNDTQGQWQAGLIGERLKLYADTWQLAAAHPLFGWGLGSYDKVLMLIRPRPLEARRQYEHSYVDAHSDWLQSLAEVGFVGTLLVGMCGVLPLLHLRARLFASPVPGYLFGGCGLILLYAWVEFPFGNPAVVIAFWTCFFCAVRYARLQDRDPNAGPSAAT